MKNYFPEMAKAEIEVKKIMLKALEEKQKELQPLVGELSIEIDSLKRDIKDLEKED